MQDAIFITGIGTDVGKTIVAAILAEALEADYWKPIQAGFEDGTDTEFIRSVISNKRTIVHPETYKLKLAASPHIAAREEGIKIDLHKIKEDYFRIINNQPSIVKRQTSNVNCESSNVNDETSTQNSELKTQNPELRTQNSELRTQNSELETQNLKIVNCETSNVNDETSTQNPEFRTYNSELKNQNLKIMNRESSNVNDETSTQNSELKTQNPELRTQNSELTTHNSELTTHSLIIEGAGGLMVPLNENEFVIDLVKKLNAKVILVSRNYLGSINHSLLTAAACKQHGLNVIGWIFNDQYMSYEDEIVRWSGYPKIASLPFATNVDSLFIQQQASGLKFRLK